VAPIYPIAQHPGGGLIAEKYELIELLGEGGMGQIWRARHVPLDAQVAIKLLRPDHEGGELAERLLREARAAARLGHPAIVRVTDLGETADGSPFLAMELLHGQSMARLLEHDGPLGAERAVQMLLPIADALVVAHRKGIIHRDLKPDNVFIALESHGIQPKLLDFGIAKLESNRRRRRLTQVGMIMGSPDYMSPEQATGDEGLDYRTDVWSFCVMLYEVLTGDIPFHGADYEAQLREIVNNPIERPAAVVDDELWAILERGLSKDREQRFPSMSKLGQALASWLLARGIQHDICGSHLESRWLVASRRPSAPPAPVSTPPRLSKLQRLERTLPPLLAALGLLALGVIGAAAWIDSARQQPATTSAPDTVESVASESVQQADAGTTTVVAY
jgi:eukaryotic-like serine/threonine-protein kinase